jgi:predicted AlkP superfamily pyrophosphatase or phosphodiesterase
MAPTADEEAHLLPAQDASHALPAVPLVSRSADKNDDADSDSDSATLGARPSGEIQDVFDEDYSIAAARPHGQPPTLISRFRSWRRGGASAIPPADASSDVSDDDKKAPEEGKDGYSKVRGRESRRHRERRRRRSERGAEVVYEMEEGGEASLSPSPERSADEADVDLAELKLLVGKARPRRKTTCCQRCLIYTAIVLFFLVLLFAAYGATFATQQPKKAVELVSNGTDWFAPTTLLISLDGFRADFLNRNLTPTLNGFIREGVSPLYMTPPFPSVTFVSHYTMSTGLYPEVHGIVGNTFWDPKLKEEFYYTHPENSMQSKWWGGEPVWVTSELQGAKAAIHMWPGSEAHIGGVDLSFVDPYNADESLDNKVKRVLGWLDLPGPESAEQIAESPRPQLIVAYVPNVDADGHLYGPNSTEIRKSIVDVDNMLGGMFDGIRQRNLSHIVNVIVVSDHGMATSSVDRLIQLDDIIDVSKIEHTDGWPNFGLRPYKDEDIEPLYRQLKVKSEENTAFDVYLRDKDMPPEYHFSNNERIAPLWMIPKTGWAIVQRKDFDIEKAKKEGLVYNPKGIHGYDYRVSVRSE